MKFSEIESDKWESLSPYLDTCLLPLTGLTGRENPVQATARLEDLRDALDCLEKPFHGRLVTYPAMHFTVDGHSEAAVNELARRIKENGFKHVILLTIQSDIQNWVMEDADLFIYVDVNLLRANPQETRENLNKKVSQMWRPVT
ncbi:DUF2487 family protein [Paenibacillus albiflavus]|nr:DUF2487 family protein [Paenibacillus albiflavus]